MGSEMCIRDRNAPQAIGPYSQAVETGNLIFISGQVPINPETGDVISSSIEDQANQVIKNIQSICEAADRGLEDIVKLSIYLTDLGNFSIVNEVMTKHFSEPYPARATIEVSALPLGVDVEIEAIVGKDG